MKPQTSTLLAAARTTLDNARRILDIDIPRQAGRLAYYAHFYAAQALILERTGKIPKTHRGVRILFHEVARQEQGLSADLAARLTGAHHLKEAADCEIGDTGDLSAADAGTAITIATDFVDQESRLFDADG